MIFDLVFLCILAWAAYKGFTKGVIHQAATLLALLLGVFGAIKFSEFTSSWLIEKTNMTGEYMPIISFALTFIAIVIAVHFIAKIIEKTVDAVALSFVNQLAGAIFSMTKFALIISVVLVVFNTVDTKYPFLPQDKVSKSLMYKPLSGFAPKIFKYLKFDNPDEIINDVQNQINV